MWYRYNNDVNIPAGDKILKGDLCIPDSSSAIVIFSHGSGSSRFSRRNRMVAAYLNSKNLGTLLFDLLSVDEDMDYSNRFDINLLTQRLTGVTKWLETFPPALNCSIGYFGASTGAASALKAAAGLKNISAIVCRGGRPDLAGDSLKLVKSPVLLIVGSLDQEVMMLNKKSMELMNCEKQLSVVKGASHLFEEPGTLDEVMLLSGEWFEKYLHPIVELYPK